MSRIERRDVRSSLSSSLPNRLETDAESQTRGHDAALSDSLSDSEKTQCAPRSIVAARRRSESFSISPTTRNFQNDHANPIVASTQPSSLHIPQTDAHQHNCQVHSMDKKIVLYKTEMCRTFEETGVCKYGLKCQFAHDPAEIRSIPRHPRYKTEVCKTFWQLGNCPYGKRCCFIHTENELRDRLRTGPPTNNSDTTLLTRANPPERDVYGSMDLLISEDSVTGAIPSHNSSRAGSPGNVHDESEGQASANKSSSGPFSSHVTLPSTIFPSFTTAGRRRTSIIGARMEELEMLIGDCTINPISAISPLTGAAASSPSLLSTQDPEVRNLRARHFEPWNSASSVGSTSSINSSSASRGSPVILDTSIEKYSSFDKSPGAQLSLAKGIWSRNYLPVMPDASNQLDAKDGTPVSGSSSRSSQMRTHLLLDMINLLDSVQ